MPDHDLRERDASARVLIVDDDAPFVLELCDALTRIGVEVCGIAVTEGDAAAKAQALRPDAVLLDVTLDLAHDGVDVGREIGERFGIPVIFLAAPGDAGTRGRIAAIGAAGVLDKPCATDDLRRALQAARHWQLRA